MEDKIRKLLKRYGIDDKESIEMQLAYITRAKDILKYSEKELKEKLKKLNKENG